MSQRTEYRHTLYGLVVSSQIACPQLYKYDGNAPPDVIIEKGMVADIVHPGKYRGFKFEASEHEVMIKTDTIARMLISAGSHIFIQPYPESSDDDVRMLLLGWGMGALLHQRGILPLHAASVVPPTDGPCMAICANSGTGKSTLTAAFLQRGYRLLDDNLSAILSGDKISILPGCPELKLGEQSLELWSRDWIREVPTSPCRDKISMLLPKHFEKNAQPLGSVFILSTGDSLRGRIKTLRGSEAFFLLNQNIFCYRFAVGMGRPECHFETLAKIANRTPIFSIELSRPRPHPDRLAAMIEDLVAVNRI